jgi:hypothetical protein
MTETSPLATLSTPTPEIARLSFDAQMAYKLKQGRPAAGVQLRLTETIPVERLPFSRPMTTSDGTISRA